MAFAELILLWPLVALYVAMLAVMIVLAIVLSILARRGEVRAMHRMRRGRMTATSSPRDHGSQL